jgi:hypothetical protein
VAGADRADLPVAGHAVRVDRDQHRLAEHGAGRAGVVAPARYLALQALRQVGDPNLDAVDGQMSPLLPAQRKTAPGNGAVTLARTRRYFFPAQMSPLRVVA